VLDEWNTSIPPPAHWQDFESLCWDLFSVALNLSETKRYGRPGQAQNGVDIFGKSKEYNGWVGLQCKKKKTYPQTQLTEGEILQEVEKARSFTPSIVHYIILTTAPRDAKIQSFVAEISTQNQESGQFSVEIYFWNDIEDLLRKHPDILKQHWSFAKAADAIQKIGEKLENGQRKICDILTTEIRQISNTITSDLVGHELSNEYREELETVKKELKEHRPSTALRLLKQFKERIWPITSDGIKYKIITYEAEAKIRLHDYSHGGRLLIEALQYHPKDEKALGNAATGYYLLGEYDRAKELALKVIEQNPVSTRGHSLLIQARGQDEPIEMILSAIPESLQHTNSIAGAAGQYFYNNGAFDRAVTWLRIALDDEKDDVAVKALLASAEYRQVKYDPTALSGLQVSERHGGLLNDAIRLFEEVLGTATEDIELQKAYVPLLIELANAKWLIGLQKDAEAAIDWAYQLETSNHTVLYLKGWHALQNDNYTEAECFFEQILWTDQYFPIPLALYLEALRRSGHAREGIEKIKRFKRYELTEEQEEVLSQEYIRCLIFMGNEHFDAALDLAYAKVREDSENIDSLLEYLKAIWYTGSVRDIQEHLDRARGLASSLPPLKQLEIADIFYFFDQYGDATEIYERCIDPHQNTEFTQRFIDSCYRAGNHGMALELCRGLHAACGPHPHTADIELAIYHEIGDMPEAKRLCKVYLDAFPENYNMKLNQAIVDLRMGTLTTVDAFLSQLHEYNISSYSQGSKLVRLFYLRSRFDDALELAYRLRKKFHSLPEAHISYINLVLDIDDRASELSEPDVVSLGTTVHVEDNFGGKRIYTIEDLSCDERSESDLSPHDPLTQLLLGKPEGSKITLPDEYGIGTEEYLTITSITSKYAYAFQESISSFNLRFPHKQGGPRRIPMRSAEDGGINPDDLGNLTSIFTKRLDWVSKILEAYKEGNVTIEKLSGYLGQDIFSVCSLLTQVSDPGMRSSSKVTGEYTELVPTGGGMKTLIIDTVALATIHSLHIGNLLIDRYGKCGVAQSTVDMIEEAILNYTGIHERASHTLTLINGAPVIHEIPAEEKKKNRENLEDILQWVRKNCAIIPCYPALQIDHAKKQQYDTLIGVASVDSILLATEPGFVLCSDDQTIHALARHEFKICSVFSIPALLLDCLHAGTITQEQYYDLMLRLVVWNYHLLPLNVELLIAAAEKASWDLKTPFTDAVESVRWIRRFGRLTELIPTLAFIRLLWEKSIDGICRDTLFLYFLTAIAPEVDAGTFMEALAYVVSINPGLASGAKAGVIQDIEMWRLMFPERWGERAIEGESCKIS